MKIVINTCYGGFGLSPEAHILFAKKKGHELTFYKQTKYAFENGKDEYKKVEPTKTKKTDLIYASTKDLGDVINDIPNNYRWSPDINRVDPDLISVIEELGTKNASGPYAELKIVEIPDGVEWQINDYDGAETISERYRTWR